MLGIELREKAHVEDVNSFNHVLYRGQERNKIQLIYPQLKQNIYHLQPAALNSCGLSINSKNTLVFNTIYMYIVITLVQPIYLKIVSSTQRLGI